MNDLTKYATLNVELTKFSKSSDKSFSLGRARVFYLGPNRNRTIITEEVAQQMIRSIGGTPVIGIFNANKDDFEGHGEGQSAYGFIPLEPNATKVEITEELLGLPVKRVYYEVDVVIWDGRFPEAAKILGEEKSLSMELNPETIQGEFEVYEDKHYVRFTNAEFIGITVLGNDKTPCFKDAGFLQVYTSMLSAYETFVKGHESENNIGGKDMSVIEKVDSTEVENTIVNEEIETVETPEVETSEEETEVEAPVETEEVTEDADVDVTEETDFEEEEATETPEEEVEDEESENEEDSEEADEEAAEETEAEEEPTTEPSEEEEVETDSTEALTAKVQELESKLEAYETAEKTALVDRFSKKINDTDFISGINVKEYSVESLKAALGAKLAEQVLSEEAKDESVPGMNYSFVNLVDKKTDSWVDLVRATKNKD